MTMPAHTSIAFFNHKGGVSKTTTTYNLGWTLAGLGHRVLMVDGDPQCNLTGMTLSFANEEDFERFYETNPKANIFGALRPAFEALPERIEAVDCFEVGRRPGLFLLPGHVRLAEYDVPLGVAHELTGSFGVMRNLPGAIGALIAACATRYNIDVVLIDMSPAIGAVNQNLLLTSTHFIVPCNPDYFCALAIDSLAHVLPRWAQWTRSASTSGNFTGAAYAAPQNAPRFLGVINQRYRPRHGVASKAFQHWIDQVNNRVKTRLAPALRDNGMMLAEADYESRGVNTDPYSLANIADFNGLIARSQEEGVPIFELTDVQPRVGGNVLENMRASRDAFRALFDRLAASLVRMTSLQSPAAATRPE